MPRFRSGRCYVVDWQVVLEVDVLRLVDRVERDLGLCWEFLPFLALGRMLFTCNCLVRLLFKWLYCRWRTLRRRPRYVLWRGRYRLCFCCLLVGSLVLCGLVS